MKTAFEFLRIKKLDLMFIDQTDLGGFTPKSTEGIKEEIRI